MLKLREAKKKMCEKAANAKKWTSDHKKILIAGGALGAVVVSTVYGMHVRKECKALDELWSKTIDAMKRKDRDFDYGPYKIMRFFEPKTEELIGEMPCHVNAVNGFLNVLEES